MIARLRRNDLVFHGAIVFAGLIVANAFNYLYFMLAGRVLGIEPYGELTSLTSAVLTLAAPANVVQIIIARLAAQFNAAGDRSSLGRLTGRALRMTTIVAVSIVVAGLVSLGPLETFFYIPSPLPILAATVSLGTYALITIQRGVLQGTQRFGALSVSYCIETVVRLIAGISLAVVWGAFGAMMGLVLGTLATLAYNLWALRGARSHGEDGAPVLDRRWIAGVAWRIGLAQLTLTVLAYYDVVIVRHSFDGRTAGLYAAAALVGRATLGVLQFVPTLVMPKATARASARKSGLPLLTAAIGIAAGLAATGVVVAAIAPGTVAALLSGDHFREAGPLVLPYVLAAAALGLANVVVAYQIGLHRYAFVMPTSIVALAEVVTIVLWHPSAAAVVGVLLAGHAAYFAASFVGIGATERIEAVMPGIDRKTPQIPTGSSSNGSRVGCP